MTNKEYVEKAFLGCWLYTESYKRFVLFRNDGVILGEGQTPIEVWDNVAEALRETIKELNS